MDQAPSAPATGAPSSTAITAGPRLGCPAPSDVAPPAVPPPAALPAWPRAAQGATAFLLGVAVALLAVHSVGYLRHGSRPAKLERGPALSYRVDLSRAGRAE